MTQTPTTELLSVVRAMRDYIDALPSDVVASLPTMPGFDRDWADEVIEAANREAQPVAFTSPAQLLKYPNEQKETYGQYSEKFCVPLYTAPPAPAVPEDIAEIIKRFQHQCNHLSEWHHIDEHSCKVDRRDLMIVTEFLSACRAAMLAQPVSQGYKLPPHVFRELVNSLRDTAVKYSGTDQLRERLNTALSQFIEPDHPHTRTTAPDSN